jgi:hypothetical protein
MRNKREDREAIGLNFEWSPDFLQLGFETSNAFPRPTPQSFNPSISQRFDRTPVVSISKSTTAEWIQLASRKLNGLSIEELS